MFGRSTKSAVSRGNFVHPAGRVTTLVRRDAAGVTVVSCGPDAATDTDSTKTPRGVALHDLVGVLHRLDLPPADAATLPRLIAAQLETLIPGQADHLCWGYHRADDHQPVAVVTAARRRVEVLLNSLPDDARHELVTTPALALHQVFQDASDDARRRALAVVGVDRDRVHLLIYREGQLVTLDTMPLDDAAMQTLGPALAGAIRTQSSGDEAMPFTVIGHPEAEAELKQHLGGGCRTADECLTITGLDELSFPNLVAVGTALAAGDHHHPINLRPRDAGSESGVDSETNNRPSLGRWIAAAVLLLGGLTLLYISDLRRADALDQAVQDAGLQATDLNTLNTDLAVARHLETAGPSFLAILDELSHQTQGFMVDEIRYERAGQFTLQATGQSADQVNQLAAKLAAMRTLTSVRIRNLAADDNNQIQYTLVALPASRFFQAFAPPVPPPPPAPPAPGISSADAAASDSDRGGEP